MRSKPPTRSSRTVKAAKIAGKAANNVKKAQNHSKTPDVSVLKHSVDTSVSGIGEILKAFQTGTSEICDLLGHECSIIYECRYCRNLFRSIANFVTHKRTFCTNRFSDVRKADGNGKVSENTLLLGSTKGNTLSSRTTSRGDILSLLDSFFAKETHESTNIPHAIKDMVVLKEMNSTTEGLFNLNKNSEEKNTQSNRDKTATLGPDGKIVGSKSSSEKFSCPQCHQEFISRKGVTIHLRSAHGNFKMCYVCPCCKKYFSNTWSVHRHLYSVHRKTSEQVRKLRTQIQKKQVTLQELDQKTKGDSTKTSVEEKPYDQDKAWMEELEGNSELMRCLGCGKKFDRRVALLSHSQACQRRARRPSAKQPEAVSTSGGETSKRSGIEVRMYYGKVNNETTKPVNLTQTTKTTGGIIAPLSLTQCCVALSKCPTPADLSPYQSDKDVKDVVSRYRRDDVDSHNKCRRLEAKLLQLHKVAVEEVQGSVSEESVSESTIRECIGTDDSKTGSRSESVEDGKNQEEEEENRLAEMEENEEESRLEGMEENEEESRSGEVDENEEESRSGEVDENEEESRSGEVDENEEENRLAGMEENEEENRTGEVDANEEEEEENRLAEVEEEHEESSDQGSPDKDNSSEENQDGRSPVEVIIIDDDDDDDEDDDDDDEDDDEEDYMVVANTERAPSTVPSVCDGSEEAASVELNRIESIDSSHDSDSCLALSMKTIPTSNGLEDSLYSPTQVEAILVNKMERSQIDMLTSKGNLCRRSPVVQLTRTLPGKINLTNGDFLRSSSSSEDSHTSQSSLSPNMSSANGKHNKTITSPELPRLMNGEHDDETKDEMSNLKLEGSRIEKIISSYLHKPQKRCLICSKNFPKIIHVRRHIALHLDIFKYKCGLNSCDFKSYLRIDMANHMLKKHKTRRLLSRGIHRLHPCESDIKTLPIRKDCDESILQNGREGSESDNSFTQNELCVDSLQDRTDIQTENDNSTQTNCFLFDLTGQYNSGCESSVNDNGNNTDKVIKRIIASDTPTPIEPPLKKTCRVSIHCLEDIEAITDVQNRDLECRYPWQEGDEEEGRSKSPSENEQVNEKIKALITEVIFGSGDTGINGNLNLSPIPAILSDHDSSNDEWDH